MGKIYIMGICIYGSPNVDIYSNQVMAVEKQYVESFNTYCYLAKGSNSTATVDLTYGVLTP